MPGLQSSQAGGVGAPLPSLLCPVRPHSPACRSSGQSLLSSPSAQGRAASEPLTQSYRAFQPHPVSHTSQLPGWGFEEARLRKAKTSFRARPLFQGRLRRGRPSQDALQAACGESSGSAPGACNSAGFRLLPINVHQSLDSSHAHGTGGVFQGHTHNPLQRHVGLRLGLSLRSPLACGLKDPGPAPPAPGASSLAPVPEDQPLPRATSSGLAGRSQEFAYEPVAPTQAHRR